MEETALQVYPESGAGSCVQLGLALALAFSLRHLKPRPRGLTSRQPRTSRTSYKNICLQIYRGCAVLSEFKKVWENKFPSGKIGKKLKVCSKICLFVSKKSISKKYYFNFFLNCQEGQGNQNSHLK